MLIPSSHIANLKPEPSLSRGMNANSQLAVGVVHPRDKSIKRDEC